MSATQRVPRKRAFQPLECDRPATVQMVQTHLTAAFYNISPTLNRLRLPRSILWNMPALDQVAPGRRLSSL